MSAKTPLGSSSAADVVEPLPWRRLGAAQLALFTLALVAFVDVHLRIVALHDSCAVECATDDEATAAGEARVRRSLKETLLNMTQSADSPHNKELWVHSMSKIQV